jgi:hypothetical protein
MEQPENPEQPIMADRVIVNGCVTELTLTSNGKLKFTERGQRSLTVEKEVLGFATEGSKIKIRAIVEGGGGGIFCVASSGALVRKDIVVESLSEDSLSLWSQKLRQYIDSLGKFNNFRFYYIYLVWLPCLGSVWMIGKCRNGEYLLLCYDFRYRLVVIWFKFPLFSLQFCKDRIEKCLMMVLFIS